MTELQWAEYYQATKEGPAHRTFDMLDPHLPRSGRAIDLGCGTGRGTLRLLTAGLHVTAVDVSPEALEIVRAKVPSDAPLELIHASFPELDLGRYDVAVGCFSLFFMEPAEHDAFWKRLVDAIEPGGLWAGQFLGVRDDWKANGWAVHDESQVRALLEPFEILWLEEEEKDGNTATGEPKHWHAFHTIGRKKG